MKILIGVCNSQETVQSEFLWSLLRQSTTVESIEFVRSGHPWDVVRNNRLIKKFLDGNCDCFIKMDTDQAYPSNYLDVMVPLVEQYKCIGPLIYDRYRGNGFIPLVFKTYKYPEAEAEVFDITGKSGIIEIPFPHTNLFYAREVLESVPAPWYEAHLSEDGLDRANHVDFSFLQKIKDAGYPIYINLDVVVPHAATVYLDKDFNEKWSGGLNHDR